MNITEAFRLVLELARQNVIDERELPDEHARQTEACDIVEKFFDSRKVRTREL